MSQAESSNRTTVTSLPPVSEDSEQITELCAELSKYLESEQVEKTYHAYLCGARAHQGQSRVSGGPYINHPIAVARILCEMRMDCDSIVAAILHDVIEDTSTRKEQIVVDFGAEVAELVDGVSKLAQIDFRSKAETQADNFRKMMLAMVKDIRVIIIKLADRLHNMRTLEAMRPDKRRRIARETMDIYAPIANRLGIFKMRHELLDLSIRAAYPMRYRALESACKGAAGYRQEIFNTIEQAICERLKQSQINVSVKCRQKDIHSIYRKMKEKKLSFKQLTDIFGVRVMTQSVDDCYRVLGVMHHLYKPLPGKFKDYLAIPKANGYQSLHSSLFGPHGVAIEVQIRTEEMDQFAESGVAAHWLYKEGRSDITSAQPKKLEWLKNLFEMQEMSGSSLEFLESVKVDLFPDEIYVFTPKGDIKKLPRRSTVVDFAYAVHTDVGNTCVAARIDTRMSPLSSRLYNGQTIQVVCSEVSRPHPSWLDFVITARARANIRHFLKSLQKTEAIALGQRLLQQAVNQVAGREEALIKSRFTSVLKQYQMTDQQTLLAEIGLGNRHASLVAKIMYAAENDESSDDNEVKPLAIRGTEGMVVSFGKCCRPVPGDAIIGSMFPGKGIVVHQQNCSNIGHTSRENRQLAVQWSDHVEGEYLAFLWMQVVNQPGVLANLSSIIANMSSNIELVNVTEKKDRISTIELVITVRDRIHLARIIKKLRNQTAVSRIWRK